MKKFVIVVVIIIVLGLVGLVIYFTTSSPSIACSPEDATRLSSAIPTSTSSAEIAEQALITYKEGKFSPECVVVSSGTNITWVNQSDENIQIGADPHPIHTGNKEVSGGGFILELSPGESSSVTMSKIGKTGYHDHLNSSATGVIIVE